MANWSGFTDDELKKMKGQVDEPGTKSVIKGHSQNVPAMKKKTRSFPLSNTSSLSNLPPAEQRLSQPSVTKDKSKTVASSKTKTHPNQSKAPDTGTGSHNEQPSRNTTYKSTNTTSVEKLSSNSNIKDVITKDQKVENKDKSEDALMDEKEELNEEEIFNKEFSNLEKFRKQQKAIEELNRKKKQILATAIVQRKKKAAAEAHKLTAIQGELDKMDHLLTVDVSIIRDKIEEASREFMDAQRRYERAEKEFIESKLHLHQAEERKESLTEHLYTVIHQNEARKAEKLQQLMQKLELENEGNEDSEITDLVTNLEIPSLTVFNDLQAEALHHVSHHSPKPATTSPTTSSQQVNLVQRQSESTAITSSSASCSTTAAKKSQDASDKKTEDLLQVNSQQQNSELAQDEGIHVNDNIKALSECHAAKTVINTLETDSGIITQSSISTDIETGKSSISNVKSMDNSVAKSVSEDSQDDIDRTSRVSIQDSKKLVQARSDCS